MTLLELVQASIDGAESDEEVVAAVRHALESGKARLCGNFREAPLDEFVGEG